MTGDSLIHTHVLAGCRPLPLAAYLKGLAVLRLVGEQADPLARGWWSGETFQLASSLSPADLRRFFLEGYSPTPLVAPWNGGSGFFPKDNRTALEAILGSSAPRLQPYREGIQSAISLLAGSSEKPDKEAKRLLLRACRRTWRGGLLRWLNAAVVLDAKGDPAPYPPLLGTGGNDGRLDFTNNFMQRLCRVIDCSSTDGRPTAAAAVQLDAALYGDAAPVLEDAPVGMFMPGFSGGPNSGPGFGGRAAANPWDYVLMLEGCILFASALTEKTRTGDSGAASSPFAVARQVADAAGYGSAAAEADTRGEQWMPLWGAPARAIEVQAMLAEGRRQIGRASARSSVDIARATARLGVARGVTSFERYGFFERNGQSFVAVPLGRWTVRAQPFQALLDRIDDWSTSLARAAAKSEAPQRVVMGNRRCQQAIMGCCRSASDPRNWQELLMALGEAEHVLARSRRFATDNRIGPLPPLDQQWLHATNDRSPELDLAVAFAAQALRGDRGQWNPRATIRSYFVPRDDRRRFSDASEAPLGGLENLEPAATGLVQRVLQDTADSAGGGYPLLAARGTGASPAAMDAFLNHATDDRRVLALSRALMAVTWSKTRSTARRQDAHSPPLPMSYALVRLAYAPTQISGSTATIRADPVILHRLVAGDMAGATRIAARRLQHAGLRPLTRFVTGSGKQARRVAASLAFGVENDELTRLARFATEAAFTVSSEEVPS